MIIWLLDLKGSMWCFISVIHLRPCWTQVTVFVPHYYNDHIHIKPPPKHNHHWPHTVPMYNHSVTFGIECVLPLTSSVNVTSDKS